MDCSMPGFAVHHQHLEFTQIHVHLVGDAIQPSHTLLSPSPLPSLFPVFSSESVLPIRWPKYWTFSFTISPSNEYSGLISFRIDWFDLPAVQGTIKSSPTPQFKSTNSLVLSFFIVQLSHSYMTTGKTIVLTRQNFVGNLTFCFLIFCLGWS